MCAGLVGDAIAALKPQLELSAGYVDTVSKGYTSGYGISLKTGTHGRALALSCILLPLKHCVLQVGAEEVWFAGTVTKGTTARLQASHAPGPHLYPAPAWLSALWATSLPSMDM